MAKILYCPECGKTKRYLDGFLSMKQEHKNFIAGYLTGFGSDISNCPYCNNADLKSIPISDDDFLLISEISSDDTNFLESMITLAEKDPIEYQLKMSQFKVNLAQTKTAEEQSKPRCPHCKSTNIKPLSALNRGTSIVLWGIFSKKINKSFKCMNCKYMW